MSSKKIIDITIIGGGPTGMFAAFYAGLRNASVKIIEALPVLGGQASLLYPEKHIYDIAGFPRITGKQLVEQLQDQMSHFDQTICLEESVKTIEKNEEGYFEITTSKTTHLSRSVIIAAGGGTFKPRKLPLEEAELFEKDNLQYIVSNKEQYKDAVVVICGGGDSAVDWALELEKIAKKVVPVHRRPAFRAHEYAVSLLHESSVEILTPFVPASLSGTGSHLESVTFKEVRGNKEVTLEVDYFIVNYGFTSSIQAIQEWGVDTTKKEILVNPKMETSVPGIYAAGDIAKYDGKIKLIATGFGDAPTAVNHAIHYIDPSQRTQPVQSTSLHLDH